MAKKQRHAQKQKRKQQQAVKQKSAQQKLPAETPPATQPGSQAQPNGGLPPPSRHSAPAKPHAVAPAADAFAQQQGKQMGTVVGLNNLGNTCFFNSAVQASVCQWCCVQTRSQQLLFCLVGVPLSDVCIAYMQVLTAASAVVDQFLQPGKRGPLGQGLHEIVKAAYGRCSTPCTTSTMAVRHINPAVSLMGCILAGRPRRRLHGGGSGEGQEAHEAE